MKTFERLAANTKEDENGCWIWQGPLWPEGYGNCRRRQAHRVVWEALHKKKLTKDVLICHRCDVKACVNPDHLFEGSHLANMEDMVTKGRSGAGSKNANAKLSEAARELIATSPQDIAFYLGKRCNVSISQIYRIRRKAKIALRRELAV